MYLRLLPTAAGRRSIFQVGTNEYSDMQSHTLDHVQNSLKIDNNKKKKSKKVDERFQFTNFPIPCQNL